jgi:hypothetical protein
MRFENTEVWGFKHAIRGMRNPMNSWDKSDSHCGMICDECNGIFDEIVHCSQCHISGGVGYIIGKNDLALMQKLIKAGTEHRKFMRQIFVSVDITAPLFWWKEFDAYKVGTVRNSCSTMHTIHVKTFEKDDFTHIGIDEVGEITQKTLENTLKTLEFCRVKFNEAKEKRYWRAIIELLPDGYNMKATITFNYENLLAMCSKGQRRFHKQNEWSGIDNPALTNFISWARTLPYAQELIFIDELETDNKTSYKVKE